MQLRGLIAVLLLAPPVPALAACNVLVSTSGVLARTGDATVLSSESGVPSVIVISGFLNPSISISDPRLESWPPGFDWTSATVEASYQAAWTLGSSSGGYSSGTQSFSAGIGLAVTVTLNNRVTAAGGFRQGNYTTKTTISCS
ncbi:MAG TPA: hypothetical protein VN109_07695 [Devosia sp.]|jgi:hypothetical protein|nr:hypothetical protein [Devosia sp.]